MTPNAGGIVRRLEPYRSELSWAALVVLVYGLFTLVVASTEAPAIDRSMTLAIHLTQGRLDLGGPATATDTVTIGGSTYWVVGLLAFLPYLPFVPFSGLWVAAGWIVPAGFGIAAAWAMLPLARRYGPGGSTTWWLAILGAFGTLLFNQATRGNPYYLTQVEAMLFTIIALVEWQGQRRAWLIGAAIGLAGLARPTVLLATLPFGLALAWHRPAAWRRLAAFGAPLVLSVTLAGLYDAARFGSPLQTGYGISVLVPVLEKARAQGLFSIRHVPQNLWLLIFNGFGFQAHLPYLVPDPNGHSVLLTSPALITAVGAGLRSQLAGVLWTSAGLITLALLLYYGGGGWVTYGYRYFLDATPFLLALVALASRRHFGALERLLIVLSVGFVAYGFVWIYFK
jgi:hypothetical protein